MLEYTRMALDGILLYKLVPGIESALPARIQKVYQISPYEILFQLHGHTGKKQLLISTHSQYNRILLTDRYYPTPYEPGNFVMLLRKYLEGQTLSSVCQAGLDRWLTLTVQRRNELGDREEIPLIVELMGKYANVILLNKEGIILDALKRIPPFTNSKRLILPGATFSPIEPQNKKNPFQTSLLSSDEPLTKQFSGFSPLLSQELEYRMSLGERFEDVMKEIENSDSLYITKNTASPLFHCIPLKHLGECKSYPLFEGFDVLYYHAEEKDRIKKITGDINHVIKTKLKHETIKLPRLLKEYDEARDCAIYKKYGDLLYSHSIGDTKGQKEIILLDYETGENVKVPLDVRLDGSKNAQKCYNKYQKLKKGQSYLEEQIALCQKEINYFNGLLEQLDIADVETAEGIKEELIKGGYISAKEGHKKKKKATQIPLHTFTLESGKRILWGKNNLQNEELTFHRAHKNDLWFHTKDYHGAHVVLEGGSDNEEEIRLAALIAAYYSKGRDSSSVPVNWCEVRQLKKIPGAAPGMVQLQAYKTIYIDPDAEVLRKLGIEP